MRVAARAGSHRARGPQDGHGRVLRRHRLHRARRTPGSRVAPRRAVALLRRDARRDRTSRRDRREVHRRRGDGGVRDPPAPRGRRAARRTCGRRDARGARRPERGARARPRRQDRREDRREHRRGRRRGPDRGTRPRDRRRRERGGPARAARAARRDPLGRGDLPARTGCGGRRTRRAARGEGQGGRVTAWRLLGVRDVPTEPRHPGSPMVGRDRQLAQLRQAYEAVVEDARCQLFTLFGSAGVGKSRLVQEFLSDLGDGATVLLGRCLPYGEGLTYYPVVEVDQAGRRTGRLRSAGGRRGQGVCAARERRAPGARLPPRVAADGRGRVGRGRGDLLGDPPVLRGHGERASARPRVRRHPLG